MESNLYHYNYLDLIEIQDYKNFLILSTGPEDKKSDFFPSIIDRNME